MSDDIVEQVTLYVNIMMVPRPPRRYLLHAMFEKLLKLDEVLGDEQYQVSLNKTFYRIHK